MTVKVLVMTMIVMKKKKMRQPLLRSLLAKEVALKDLPRRKWQKGIKPRYLKMPQRLMNVAVGFLLVLPKSQPKSPRLALSQQLLPLLQEANLLQ